MRRRETGGRKVASQRVRKTTAEIYEDELLFLLGLKRVVGILHNRIHDSLAALAIEKLRLLHPGVDFDDTNATAAGPDIVGRKRGATVVLGEVKTTLPNVKGTIRGPKAANLLKDLKRLQRGKAEFRYLVVLSRKAKQTAENLLNSIGASPRIRVFDALGDGGEDDSGVLSVRLNKEK